MKKALVCGAGGFIGSHLVNRLKREGFWVRGVDLKHPEFSETTADDFILGDLRDPLVARAAVDVRFDEIYQLAADMGGAGYVFTGENDAAVMHNSALINLNILEACQRRNSKRIFYSSSACIYPEHQQRDPDNVSLPEDCALSRRSRQRVRLGEAVQRTAVHGLRAQSRLHRAHCPLPQHLRARRGLGQRQGEVAGRARQEIAMAPDGGSIDIWGDGLQTRSFLYIDECLEGTVRLARSSWSGPVNIGSDEMVTINGLAGMLMQIAGKTLTLRHVPGPSACAGATRTTL
jgi:nucleoside-diphosphate-sugar epimerase